MNVRRYVVATAAAVCAGIAAAAVVENPALVPTLAPPVRTAPPGPAPGSDLILWHNPGTAFNRATALRKPGHALPTDPALPGKSAQDSLFEIDLFHTIPVRPALP